MTNVVSFPARDQDRLVYVCGCGCRTHFARADGELECANCGALDNVSGGEWRRRLPEPPASPEPLVGGYSTVVELDTDSAAIARMARDAEPGKMAVMILIFADGTVRSWGREILEAEQIEWLDKRLGDAREMLTRPQ